MNFKGRYEQDMWQKFEYTLRPLVMHSATSYISKHWKKQSLLIFKSTFQKIINFLTFCSHQPQEATPLKILKSCVLARRLNNCSRKVRIASSKMLQMTIWCHKNNFSGTQRKDQCVWIELAVILFPPSSRQKKSLLYWALICTCRAVGSVNGGIVEQWKTN